MQAKAIQDMLRSSTSPPDTPTRQQNRANVAKFMRGTLATNTLHKELTTYVYNSHIVKSQQQCRDNQRRSQVQKGGIVYTKDVDHDIAGAADCILAWQPEDLDENQKLYRLKLSYYVLPQLIVRTRAR